MLHRPWRGQVVLELVLALIVTLLLCVGIIGIWSWLVRNIVRRQIAYEQTRCEAGTAPQFTCGDKPGEPGKVDYFTPGPGGVVDPGEEPPGGPPGGGPPGGGPPGDPAACPVDLLGLYNSCVRACRICADQSAQCEACLRGMSTCCTVGTDIVAYCREYAGCPP